MLCESDGSQRWGLEINSLPKQAVGKWRVTSLIGKAPELVQEVERHWTGCCHFTITHKDAG